MITSVSSQAGVIASRRKKLDQTGFNNYRYVKVEYNDQYFFASYPPGAVGSFTLRHLYKYDKINNDLIFLGNQKAQSLKRTKIWPNQITVFGFSNTIVGGGTTQVNGTYTRNLPYENFYNNINSNLSISNANFLNGQDALLYDFENDLNVGNININIGLSTASFVYVNTDYYTYDNTPPTVNILYNNTWLDNTSLNNINSHRLYNNTDPDLGRNQLISPNVNIDLRDIFSQRNLAHNQIVFIDTRWIAFGESRKSDEADWWAEDIGGLWMNHKKGHIYRAGIIIKDNIIDSMVYYTDLVDNNNMIRGHAFSSVGI